MDKRRKVVKMKTTKEIWEENTIEEPALDEFGRQRDIIKYFDITNANQEWYSKEDIINAITRILFGDKE
jgi:hypothetical protein